MAATVVSVVIFLCGALVGCGVKTEAHLPPQTDSQRRLLMPCAAAIGCASPDSQHRFERHAPLRQCRRKILTRHKRLEENNKKETLKAVRRERPRRRRRQRRLVQPPRTPAAVPAPAVATAKSCRKCLRAARPLAASSSPAPRG